MIIDFQALPPRLPPIEIRPIERALLTTIIVQITGATAVAIAAQPRLLIDEAEAIRHALIAAICDDGGFTKIAGEVLPVAPWHPDRPDRADAVARIAYWRDVIESYWTTVIDYVREHGFPTAGGSER